MSQKEGQCLGVLLQVQAGALTQAQAGAALGLSVRQVKRLCRALRAEGAPGLISRRRGVPSNRRIPQVQREHFLGIVRQRYADFGPQLAHEYLRREHGFAYSCETLRGWMAQAGLWKAHTRRAARLHSPRPRRACRGELVQIDGSHHDWFEQRAPKFAQLRMLERPFAGTRPVARGAHKRWDELIASVTPRTPG